MSRVLARSGFVGLIVIIAIASTLRDSQAITYTYQGTCATDCDQIGLVAGAAVSGSISFLDGSLVPGSVYPLPTSFALNFGSVEITDATAGAFGLVTFLAVLPPVVVPAVVPADLAVFGAELQTAENPVAPATSGDGVGIYTTGIWAASPFASCDADCHLLRTRGTFTEGTGTWLVAAASVPEPTTLSLVATGVVGAIWGKYRRRSGARTESSRRRFHESDRTPRHV
jgi:hypothetical protein